MPIKPILNTKRRSSKGGQGCVFSAIVGLTAIFLLIVNAIVVQAFVRVNFQGIDERFFHPIQFTLPIAMIFAEYWLFDRILRYFENRFSKQKK